MWSLGRFAGLLGAAAAASIASTPSRAGLALPLVLAASAPEPEARVRAVWFPLVDLGPGWRSAVRITNLGAAETDVTVIAYPAAAGAGRSRLGLAPGASVSVDHRELGADVRALGLESDGEINARLVAVADDRRGVAEIPAVTEAWAEARVRSPAAGKPWVLALLNPSRSQAVVRLGSATDGAERAGEEGVYRVAPGETVIVSIAAVASGAEPGVELRSDHPVVAMGVAPGESVTAALVASTASPVWRWPFGSATGEGSGQDYAEYGLGEASHYHAGYDLGPGGYTSVLAVGAGWIVKMQEYNAKLSSGRYEDHGFGNTVIVYHGNGLYSQYSHLASFAPSLLSRCGLPDAGLKGRHTCRTPVPVAAGDTLGQVGGTGYNSTATWGVHLHFEVKTFDTLGWSGDDSGNNGFFGYTAMHPDQGNGTGRRFLDPAGYHHDIVMISARQVQLAQDASVRTGPAMAYKQVTMVRRGVAYRATDIADQGRDPACLAGWFHLQPLSGMFHDDTQPAFEGRTGQLPQAWVCGTSLTSTPSPSPTPAPTPAPTPTPTPVLRIDNTTSSSRPPGQTFSFVGTGFTAGRTVTRWMRQPNGSQITLTPTLSASGSGAISWTYTPVCTTPKGTYTVWAVDDLTGRASNSVTEIVLPVAGCY